nr:hypothetical protein BaRGS_032144 [Batillaria attramentaria]
MFDPADHLHVRYLDLSGSFQPDLEKVHYMGYLHFLNLSSCGLNKVTLRGLVHVRVLDLSWNQLNALSRLFIRDLLALRRLNLSHNLLFSQLDSKLADFLSAAKVTSLQSLFLRDTGIEYIEENAFENLTSLLHVDIRENEIVRVNKLMFYGLTKLEVLETDDPRVCCPYFYQYPNATTDCRTPIDELSSCSDLLRSDVFRAFLWALSAMAICGNVGVLIYRVFLEKQGTSFGFRVLVANLCVADFLMGVYLLIIGAADTHYSGQYIWQQDAWTRSGLCKTAGFLALLSSEVSAFVICLITIDRLLVLCLPLKKHLHLTVRSATIACGAVWLIGLVLGFIPFMPSDWTFYGHTGICLPLPITRRPFPGQQYAFGVFVVLNFLLFLFIGVGQLCIYQAIRSSAMSAKTHRHKQDMNIARRLFLIAFTDFCCWFPIGLMGMLASHDTPIPGIVNVVAAIFVLPVNSAINPFLYTLNMLREKRRKLREEKRIQTMLAKLHAEMVAWPHGKLQELHAYCERLLVQVEASESQSARQVRGAERGGVSQEDHTFRGPRNSI